MTELEREIIDLAVSRTPQGLFFVAADVAYANDTLPRGLPSNVHRLGAMAADPVLRAPPTVEEQTTGRRRKPGLVLPKPLGISRSTSPSKKLNAFLHGKRRTVQDKAVDLRWYRGAGARMLHIVVVRLRCGKMPVRVFLSTDRKMNVAVIFETYGGQWSTEVCFRNIRQLLGLGESQAYLRCAVERTAPFVGIISWLFALEVQTERTWKSEDATPPIPPSYPTKNDSCFADVLRAA